MSAADQLPSLSEANSARREADLYRSEWMVGVYEGLVTAGDLIVTAGEEHGRALRRLRLVKILANSPEVSVKHAEAVVKRFGRRSGINVADPNKLTVGRVVDGRSLTSRVTAWFGSLMTDEIAPESTFPWSARPKVGRL